MTERKRKVFFYTVLPMLDTNDFNCHKSLILTFLSHNVFSVMISGFLLIPCIMFFSVVGGSADILARRLIVICLSLHNSIIRSLTDSIISIVIEYCKKRDKKLTVYINKEH